MKIEKIEVSYQVTQALPNYCNIKPGITISAIVEPDDDSAEIEVVLWEQAKQAVHAQVDAALEEHDQPARYSSEPRFDVIGLSDKTVAIVPTGQRGLINRRCIFHHSGLRLQHAWRVAELRRQGHKVIDCSDGDTSALLDALERNRHSGEVSLPF